MLRGSDHVAGIDLGTTNSCISIFKNQHVEVAVDALGNRTTPSMVAFNDTGRLYGRSAKMQVVHNCKNTVYDAKRLIGHLYNEPGVQEDIKHWPFTVKANEKGRPIIEVTCKKEKMEYTPEQISGFVIENLISIANSFSNGSITDVVITVPAYFNNSQRQATIDAGTLAGCNVLEVLNEPTAAAIAYGFENTGNKTILVYDLGGGTFDCTILRVEDSVYTVIGTDGDSHLGGDDFDAIMMNLIQQKLEMMECTVDFTTDRNKQKLRNVAEHAKIELSSLTEVDISEDSWECEPFVITRKEFEQSCMDLFNRTQSILKRLMTSTQVLERLNASAEEMTEKIDDVVLIGGSSRIPYVKNMLISMFGEEKVFEKINPDEAVSKGAVIEAVRLKDLQEKAKESKSASDEGGFDIDTDDDDDDESRYAPLAIKKLTVKQVIPLPIGVKRSDGHDVRDSGQEHSVRREAHEGVRDVEGQHEEHEAAHTAGRAARGARQFRDWRSADHGIPPKPEGRGLCGDHNGGGRQRNSEDVGDGDDDPCGDGARVRQQCDEPDGGGDPGDEGDSGAIEGGGQEEGGVDDDHERDSGDGAEGEAGRGGESGANG